MIQLRSPHTLGQHFAYALGRLGVLEDQLLKPTDIDRLLGAPTGKEAVKMLRDIEFVASPESDENFQETLNASTALVKENVEKMAPEDKHFIFDILWIEGDRARIAYELKKKNNFTSAIASEPLPPISTGLDLIFDQSFSTPIEIDNAVAEACNEHIRILAKQSGSRLIRSYVQKVQDLESLRSIMRGAEHFSGVTLSGVEGQSQIETIAFEKEGMEQINEILSEMQKVTLGPEALFSYAVRALNQIQLLKVLLTGKVNNLPIQETKSLLPPLL